MLELGTLQLLKNTLSESEDWYCQKAGNEHIQTQTALYSTSVCSWHSWTSMQKSSEKFLIASATFELQDSKKIGVPWRKMSLTTDNEPRDCSQLAEFQTT